MKMLPKSAKAKQTELSPIHDFAAKLKQPSVLPRLKDYVRWQVQWRKARSGGTKFQIRAGNSQF